MARIKCKQCGKKFSDSNDRCPRCGNSGWQHRSVKWLVCVIVLVLTLGIGVGIYAISYRNNLPPGSVELLDRQYEHIPDLDELLSMSSEELAKQDIAVINLACAEGLYGAENLDVKACLRQLDEWAVSAASLLKEREFMFYKTADKLDNSINRWRCAALGQYLSQVVELSYHPGLRDLMSGRAYDTHHFHDSRDFLIHGLILEKNRGTCASMPVLYAAIARRLGYPIEFVRTRNHLFCRWVDPEGKETFNIEWTDTYVEFKSNEFYKTFPAKLNPGEVERLGYLRPLTAEEAMSAFVHLRAMCLWYHKDLEGARKAFIVASRLDGDKPSYRHFILAVERQIRHSASR